MTASGPNPGVKQKPTARYAVFGNPIKHSKSPAIHAQFAEQLGEAISYRAVAVQEAQFEEQVRSFFHNGGCGLNITVPFKERAFSLADSVSEAAQRAEAANCLMPLETGGIYAHNTDGTGMVRDMVANLGWQLHGRRVLIIGAGGAVRGIVHPLLREGLAALTVINRTPERAEAVVAGLGERSVEVRAAGLADVAGQTFDLVINGTSSGLDGEMPTIGAIRLAERCCCYDLFYAAQPTAFMQWAAANAAWAIADGLGMLVEQAAESYYLWRNRRPDTGEVIAGLREQLLAQG